MRVLAVAVLISVATAAPAAACGSRAPVGAAVEDALKGAKLAQADLARVRAMQSEIKALASSDEEQARKVEERAMQALGYKKVWLRCGPGSFAWQKVS